MTVNAFLTRKHVFDGDAAPRVSRLWRSLIVVLSVLTVVSGAWYLSSRWVLHIESGRAPYFRRAAPTCRPASGTVSVATDVINIVAQVAIVPAVQDESNIAVIPEQEDDHIWVDRIILQHFQLKKLSVKTATPDSSSMTISARGFGLEVNKTRFRYTYLGIRCYGHFTATLDNTDADTVLSLRLLPEGRWEAAFPVLNLTWGTLAIQHALDSKACGIAQSIVELFTGKLDKYIADKVQKKLDQDGRRKAAEVLNDAFAAVGVRALTPPLMTPERLTVVLDATPSSVGCPPQNPVKTVPSLLPRDIATHTTALDVNNALYNSAVMKKLRVEEHLPDSMNTSLFSDVLPDVYAMCPDCPLFALVDSPQPPQLTLLPTNTFTVTATDMLMGLYVVPRSPAERERVLQFVADRSATPLSGFAAHYRRWGHDGDFVELYSEDLIPVLALDVSVTLGVRNVTVERGRLVHYEVLPMTDLLVSVVASNIGDVNVHDLMAEVSRAYNEFVMPLANAASPYKLPFFVRKAELIATLEAIDAGLNIGVRDAMEALMTWRASK